VLRVFILNAISEWERSTERIQTKLFHVASGKCVCTYQSESDGHQKEDAIQNVSKKGSVTTYLFFLGWRRKTVSKKKKLSKKRLHRHAKVKVEIFIAEKLFGRDTKTVTVVVHHIFGLENAGISNNLATASLIKLISTGFAPPPAK